MREHVTLASGLFVGLLVAAAGAACSQVSSGKPQSATEEPTQSAQGEEEDSPGLREHPH